MFLLRFCSKTLPIKWLWRRVTSACHVQVQQPPRLCTASLCEISKLLMSRKWKAWLTCQHCPKTWFTTPMSKDQCESGPSAGCVEYTARAHGLRHLVDPWQSRSLDLGPVHLTAWPLCLKCLGGQAWMCPIWPLWATRPRKYPRRTPNTFSYEQAGGFPMGLVSKVF